MLILLVLIHLLKLFSTEISCSFNTDVFCFFLKRVLMKKAGASVKRPLQNFVCVKIKNSLKILRNYSRRVIIRILYKRMSVTKRLYRGTLQ